MVRVKRIGSVINEFGLWIPALPGMTVMVRLPQEDSRCDVDRCGMLLQYTCFDKLH